MQNAEQVQTLLEDCQARGLSKAATIEQIAAACLGWPYVFGALGEMCTPQNRDRRSSSAYPSIVNRCQVLNGSTGMTSRGAMIFFNALIQYGTPKLAVFATGMNDGSGTSTAYLTNRATFLSICEANGITPIFCTVPTVPTVNNEAKNEWVRGSNYRYIDFAGAVGADANGNWYAGMLDTGESPAVHPTAKGAKALYTQVLIDLPEIADI